MNSIEETFVTNFIQKSRRERSLFELGSESRRGKFLNRLCHDFAAVLDSRYLQPLHGAVDAFSLLKLLQKNGAQQDGYLISSNDAVDGRHLPLQEAINAVVGFGLPSVLICVPDSLAYFEAEQVQGAPPRFLLVRRRGTQQALGADSPVSGLYSL